MSPLFLPLLCPMGPRDILELDLLQTQLEPGELCLVLRDPPSLDRPESSRRRCELGGDRVVSHSRGRMRCRCRRGRAREPGPRGRPWSRRPEPRNRGSHRVEPSRSQERRRRWCSATRLTLPPEHGDGTPRGEGASGRRSSAPACSTLPRRRPVAPTRLPFRRGVPPDVPVRGGAFDAFDRARLRRAAPRRAGGAARGVLLYPVESASPSRSPV